jgi:hypothetical protein
MMLLALLGGLLMALSSTPALADVLHADPRTYAAMVPRLRPGDTLVLAPGDYRDRLRLHGLHGTADAPIVIRGPATGTPARFIAQPRANTVTLRNASYLVVESLLLDGAGLAVDGLKAEDPSTSSHHITVANLTIVNHGAGQQTVGISTKAPAWNWIVRGNRIIGAGTGMYFGNADGTCPFVAGIIEDNVVLDTIGYALQVKHQRERPARPGMPTGRSVTVIRRNVFAKSPRVSSREHARPNVLVGHLPLSGPGARDEYQIYGNLFLDNPGEALLQAEGNVTVYNNIFVNRRGDAIVIQPHNHLPRHVLVFHNTVLARNTGVLLKGGEPGYVQTVEGNAIFAGEPLGGADATPNLTGSFAAAREWLVDADVERGRMNPALRADRPPPNALLGRRDLPDVDRDYFGHPRSADVPGAVAGPGAELELDAERIRARVP